MGIMSLSKSLLKSCILVASLAFGENAPQMGVPGQLEAPVSSSPLPSYCPTCQAECLLAWGFECLSSPGLTPGWDFWPNLPELCSQLKDQSNFPPR